MDDNNTRKEKVNSEKESAKVKEPKSAKLSFEYLNEDDPIYFEGFEDWTDFLASLELFDDADDIFDDVY